MIEDYKFGQIKIDGQEYSHDVWIGLEEISDWWRQESHNVSIEDVKGVLGEHPEMVVIGCGADSIMKVSDEVKEYFEDKKTPVIIKDSKAACAEYNRLKNKKKRVVALIHLTC